MTRILIIDDSDLVSRLLHEAMTEAGYEAAVASDANQGNQVALEFQPDLILLDVNLPDVMGFDLLRVIRNREELSNLPIIMITGSHQTTEHKLKGFQTGADDYVLKPFEMPVLLERIKVLLRRSESQRLSTSRPATPSAVPNPTPVIPEPVFLSIGKAVSGIFCDPLNFPEKAHLPPLSMAFIASVLILILGGLGFTAGGTLKPAVAALAAGGLWVSLISALVMTSSLLGITLGWREGARLFALAAAPILLKLFGAFAASASTALTPFYFTASPGIFLVAPPFWLSRLDLFEIWSVVLLWVLIRKRTGADRKSAWIVTGVVWVVGVALAMALGRLGGS